MIEEYTKILDKVARKEIFSTVFWMIVLLVIVLVIWISNYFYYKKQKNKNPNKYSSPKQIKARRKGIWASVAMSVICFAMASLLCFGTVSRVSDIQKDIDGEAFITYSGKYYVTDNVNDFDFGQLYHSKWVDVSFENDGYALMRVDNFFELISTEQGAFDGKVVYGKNSLIVVEME